MAEQSRLAKTRRDLLGALKVMDHLMADMGPPRGFPGTHSARYNAIQTVGSLSPVPIANPHEWLASKECKTWTLSPQA
jgi:hypothetical protein